MGGNYPNVGDKNGTGDNSDQFSWTRPGQCFTKSKPKSKFYNKSSIECTKICIKSSEMNSISEAIEMIQESGHVSALQKRRKTSV